MNVLIAGRMKQGKTNLALYLACRWARVVVVWDPRHMIDFPPQFRNTVILRGDDLGGQLEDALHDVQEQPPEKRAALIIIRPDGLRLEEDFEAICAVLFSPPERYQSWAFIVDEAADLQRPQAIEPRLRVAVKQHPRSVLVIQTTHALQEWHRASKGQISELFCFRMVGRDAQVAADFCDEGPEFERVLKTLPPHVCIRYDFEDLASEQPWEVWSDPSAWYMGATETFEREQKEEPRGDTRAEEEAERRRRVGRSAGMESEYAAG